MIGTVGIAVVVIVIKVIDVIGNIVNRFAMIGNVAIET